MARIFVSHASADDTAVTELSKWLAGQGFDDQFVDHIHIPAGTSWDRTLPKEASRAEIVIIYLTKAWLSSKECLAEYRASYYAGKVILPLLITDSLHDLPPAENSELQKICSSVQGISIKDFPPDDVVSGLFTGSLMLSTNRIKWAKRKRLIQRTAITVGSFVAILVILGVYFRDYLGAYFENQRIAAAFAQLPAEEQTNSSRSAEELGFRECDDATLCPTMVVLPAGRFHMGASDDFMAEPSELPGTILDVPTFAVSKHEITKGQWHTCFLATRLGDGPKCKEVLTTEETVNLPVDSVSWTDARTYVRWLNTQITGEADGPYRLLSEAEWEYAARGSAEFQQIPPLYFWGDSDQDACRYANALNNTGMPVNFSIDRPGLDCPNNPVLVSEVGKLEPNGFGLHDTAGNLAEWVEDCWHDSYHNRPAGHGAWVDSGNETCDRVIRGGSWIGEIDNLRSAARVKLAPDLFGFNIGFRVARTLD